MKALRQRAVRLVSAVFFAALLLVPLLESGHSHDGRDLARPCPTCVATQHSPAAATLVVALSAPISGTAVAFLAPIESPARRDHSPQTGRAPPAAAPIASV